MPPDRERIITIRVEDRVLVEPPNLLITDDDGAFRETLRGVFAGRGFRTITAGDGAEALEIVRGQPIHLLLTDMHMPKMTGLETIRRIRQARLVLPCILLSGRLDERLTEAARLVEAFSVLSKPVRFAEVTDAVQRAMMVTYGWPDEDDEAEDGLT